MNVSAAMIVIAILAAFGGVAVGTLFSRRTFRRRLAEAQQRTQSRSRSTIRGQVAEQLAPLLPEFPYANADAKFLGAPVDYVVFDGLADGEDVEVVFVEIKTGKSGLSERERAVRDAIEKKRVFYEVVRIVGSEE